MIVWTPGVGADTLTKLQETGGVSDAGRLFPLPDGGTLLVDLGDARLIRIEVDLSFGETWSIAQGAPGTGLAMISPVGTDRTGGIYFRQRLGGMTWMSDAVNGSAKIPAIRPGFPAIRARQARSWTHGKNGRSCSPG